MKDIKYLTGLILVMSIPTLVFSKEPEDEYQAAARKMQADQAEQRTAAIQRATESRGVSQQWLRHSQELEQQELQFHQQLGQQQRRQLLERDRQQLQQQAAKNQFDAAADRQRMQTLQSSSRAALREAQSQLLKSLRQQGSDLLKQFESHSAETASTQPEVAKPTERQNSESPALRNAPAIPKRSPSKKNANPAVADRPFDSDSPTTPSQLASFLGGGDSDICKDLARKIEDAIYRDKRAGTSKGGIHGLWHRLREQVSGTHGPGSRKWDGHTQAIENQQQYLRDLLDLFATNYCGQPPRIARQIASRPAPAPSEWQGQARFNVLEAPSSPACQALGGLAALTAGIAACTTEGAAGVLVCSPFAEVPVIPLACGAAACTQGAMLSATTTFALTERACSMWMSQRQTGR